MVTSIIVPAYNESKRISSFLEDLVAVISKGDYELIIVDDGSKDNTVSIVTKITRSLKNVKIIRYSPNMGKGYTVKEGILAAKGNYIIFIDADGSIPPSEITKMEKMLKEYDIVVGDRTSEMSRVEQPKIRKMLGIIFNNYIDVLFRVDIKDFLCGFKGFKKNVGKIIFSGLISNRWMFDVEIFYRARRKDYSIYKLPIMWVHKPDTKIKFLDPLKMFFEAILLRIRL